MRLLFITQKVSRRDPVLGFVHAWLLEFSKHFVEIIVVCLEKGDYEFPNNVRVYSLGKEEGRGRLHYLLRFFSLIWGKRSRYDVVFVHMNPVYIFLAGFVWKLFKKPVALWYIHPKRDPLLAWIQPWVDIVFTATLGSFPLKWRKVRPVGHGIDTDFFTPQAALRRKPNSLLVVGRIAPIKRLELIYEALIGLQKDGRPFYIEIIGGKDETELGYYQMVQSAYKSMVLKGVAYFSGPLSKEEVRDAYNTSQILINFTPTGSFDKVVLEAMAMESIPVTGNTAFRGELPRGCFVETDSSAQLYESLSFILGLSSEIKAEYGREARKYVLENHNLKTLPLKIKLLYEGLLQNHEKV